VVPFGSRPQPYGLGVLELVAPTRLSVSPLCFVLSATFLRLSGFLDSVKLYLFAQGRSNTLLAVTPCFAIRFARLVVSLSRSITLRINVQERPALSAWAYLGPREFPLGSCNGLFSAGFPTGATGESHRTLRTSFPTSLFGQAIRPPGGSTATVLLTATFQEYQTSS